MPEKTPAARNVIVVMYDSLQFNYLGCYGNPWIKTPHFDRFAREGVLFENNYIEGLPTVPARRAMHTGRYTLPVGGWIPLALDDTTIADLCWGHPIDTGLIFDCPMYRLPKFGYTRGFDKVHFFHGHEADHEFFSEDPLIHLDVTNYYERHVLDTIEHAAGKEVLDYMLFETSCYLKETQHWKSEKDQRTVRVANKAVEYLEQADRNKSFFLWVDSFDPHEPWDPPSVYDPDLPCPYDPDYKGKDQFNPVIAPVKGLYTEEEMHHIRMLYAEKVTMCDRWFGHLMDNVRRLGLEENTLVLLVSDHGEPMGNGEHGHGIMRKCRPWPYEELAHAPLIMRGPGLPAGKRISAFTQSVDVAPTACDWLGIGAHPSMQGKSLLPLARGEVQKIRDFAIAGYFKYSWSIITEEWSYIHWLAKDASNAPDVIKEMYTLDGNSRLGGAVGNSEAVARHKAAASLDGADQWTCTPASKAEVPDVDELYDRKADPFQLNNLIREHPDEASEMLKKLRLFMQDLKAS
jgi:arylsulfatase A-like enzyme